MNSTKRTPWGILAMIIYIWAAVVGAPAGWASVGPPGGSVYAFAIHPSQPDTVYATVLGRGVYKSTDGGGSWVQMSAGLTGQNAYSMAMYPSNPDVLYVGVDASGAGVY